jgi:hypothetical protein
VSADGPLTRIGMAPRAEGLSIEAAQAHWRVDHRDVAVGLPGIRGYVQNHVVLRDGRPLLPYAGFDVCAETEWDGLAEMRAAFASPHYQGTVRDDERKLIDGARFSLALTRRRVLAAGEPDGDPVKLLTFLRAHPTASAEALVDTLAGPYAAAVLAGAAPLRHELLVVDRGAHDGDRAPCCDVVDITWFRDPDAALAALTGPLSEAGWLLGGLTFGAERVLARPLRMV